MPTKLPARSIHGMIRLFLSPMEPDMKLPACLLLLAALLIPPGSMAASGGDKGPYLSISPPIVVNLQGSGKRVQFMQIEIDAMSRDNKVLAALQEHVGPVRHALLVLLSSQTAEDMWDLQKREEVRQQALENLQEIIATHAGLKPGALEALYFTNLVIQ